MLTNEWFQEEAVRKVVLGDIFDFEYPVIPVMTGGRAYGQISQEAVRRGARIPTLAHTCAASDDKYIYVALWTDSSVYNADDIADCAVSAFREGLKLDLKRVHLPILGGKEGAKFLWAAEKGIWAYADGLEAAGFPYPDHIYVSDKLIR